MAKLNMRLILGLNSLKCSVKVDFTTSIYFDDSISSAVEPENLHPCHHEMREQEMTTSGRIEVVLRTERTLPAGSADALIALFKVTYSNLSRSAHAEAQVSAPGTHA